jgi:hypothetical protein
MGGARGGLPAACGRPAGRPMGTQPWLWCRMFETAVSWAGDEAGLERREDRPPRANRPNGVERRGRRRARSGDVAGFLTSGNGRKGRDGPLRGCGAHVEGRGRVCGSPTVADAGGPARPLPSRSEAWSVRGEEAVTAGRERSGAGVERPGLTNALSFDGTVFKGKVARFPCRRLIHLPWEPSAQGSNRAAASLNESPGSVVNREELGE